LFLSSAKQPVPSKDELTLKTPWKPIPTPTPVSLKSTFSNEKESNVSKPVVVRQPYVLYRTVSNKNSFFIRSVPMTQTTTASQHDAANPWSSLATSPPTPSIYSTMSIASSPSAPPMSFKHIQDQETRAHEALRQLTNKSLEKIQVIITLFHVKRTLNRHENFLDGRISDTSSTSSI